MFLSAPILDSGISLQGLAISGGVAAAHGLRSNHDKGDSLEKC